MDSHLVPVPGLGTLTTGTVQNKSRLLALPAGSIKNYHVRLPGGVLEDLGGKSDGAPDVEVSVLGTVDEVGTDYRNFHQPFSPVFQIHDVVQPQTNTSQEA